MYNKFAFNAWPEQNLTELKMFQKFMKIISLVSNIKQLTHEDNIHGNEHQTVRLFIIVVRFF